MTDRPDLDDLAARAARALLDGDQDTAQALFDALVDRNTYKPGDPVVWQDADGDWHDGTVARLGIGDGRQWAAIRFKDMVGVRIVAVDDARLVHDHDDHDDPDFSGYTDR